MMEFCIGADALRKALAEIEQAEANGFEHCLAVFRTTSVGRSLDECRAVFSDLSERAHPTDGNFNWGRFQAVTKRNKFVGGKLVPLPDMTKDRKTQ